MASAASFGGWSPHTIATMSRCHGRMIIGTSPSGRMNSAQNRSKIRDVVAGPLERQWRLITGGRGPRLKGGIGHRLSSLRHNSALAFARGVWAKRAWGSPPGQTDRRGWLERSGADRCRSWHVSAVSPIGCYRKVADYWLGWPSCGRLSRPGDLRVDGLAVVLSRFAWVVCPVVVRAGRVGGRGVWRNGSRSGRPLPLPIGIPAHTRWHYHDWRVSHNASQRLHS
jgi:hypothetical protein